MKKKKSTKIIAAQLDVMVIFAAIFSVGLLLAELLPADIYPALLVAAVVCLLISLPESCARYRTAFLVLGALSAAAFYGNIQAIPPADYSDYLRIDGTNGILKGEFKGEYSTNRSGGITLKLANSVYEIDGQNVKMQGKVQCRVSEPDFMPEPEQTYSLTGKFSASELGKLPVFIARNFTSRTENLSLYTLAGKIQRRIRDGLSAVLPTQHAGIVTGLILGDTSQISLEDRQLFKETGISHLLAVSGQHIMVVIMLLAAILHWVKVPPVSRSIAITLFLVVYALTTVASPSVWRALVMYLCVAVILHTEAYSSPVRPVAMAGLLLLLYDPALISNAAFQLSFTAVISIVFLRPPIEHYLRKFYFPETLARYLAVTFAANLGTMPMTAFLFGTVSASAFLVNPLLIWSFSYILPVAFGTALLSTIWPAAAIIIAPGLSLVIDGMMALLKYASSIPGQFFFVGNIPGFIIAAVYGAMLLLVAGLNHRQVEEAKAACLIKTSVVENKKPDTILTKPGLNNKPTKPLIEAEVRVANPFRHGPTIKAMDAMLIDCRRRPLKNTSHTSEPLMPLQLLTLDSQNLYHQLIDLDRKSFAAEPERLLQAHIYLIALVGNEILNRIGSHLNPSPKPGDIRIEHVVKDRFLATAILTDSVLNSSLLTRAATENFMMCISRAQSIFNRARNQLERILHNADFNESIEQHQSLRQDLLAWCVEFIEFDNSYKRNLDAKLRPEQ